MLSVFLLQNQYDQYLGKSGEWLSGADSKTLYRTQHKDEAINQKVEVAVKQADTRAKIVDGIQLLNGQVMLSENEPLPIAAMPESDLLEETLTEDSETSDRDLLDNESISANDAAQEDPKPHTVNSNDEDTSLEQFSA